MVMPSTSYRFSWIVVFLIGSYLFLDNQSHDWTNIARGVALTIAPLLCFLGLIQAMDRWHLLDADQWVAGLAWGGGVVAMSAAWLNGVTELALNDWAVGHLTFTPDQATGFGNLVGSVVSAPIVEETGKGFLGLVGLWSLRRPLRSPLQAALLGCVIALAFGSMENAPIFANFFSGSGSWTWSEWLASPRQPMPMLHALFTLPMACLIGRAAYSPSLARRVGLVMLGWGSSVLLHSLWNWDSISREKELGYHLGIDWIGPCSPILVPMLLLLIRALETRKLRHFRPDTPAPARAWVPVALLRRLASRLPLNATEQKALASYEAALLP
jgi:RsiW-degrading membrane proteinase PrsW (M82 family)